MWRALRAELAYSRPWLLGGLGIAAGVVLILTVVFLAVGQDGPPSHVVAGLRGMFLLMATIVVGYIVPANFAQERRARMLLAGPLAPWQIAGLRVLLPTILLAPGVLAAGLVIGADALLTGRFVIASARMAADLGAQMFVIGLLVLLAQEATVARRQRRLRAAVVGWSIFVAAIAFLVMLVLASIQGGAGWIPYISGHLVVAIVALAASVALYAGRTDFTR